MTTAVAPSSGLRRRRRRERTLVVAFLAPWLLGTGLFFLYPLVSTVVFSFQHYDQIDPPTWVGLRNWTYVFTEYDGFWQAMRNTLWLVVVMVTARVVFGVGIGLLVTKIKTGARLFRTVFYLPYLAPPVAATIAFAFLLNPGTGAVNTILGDLHLGTPGWFNDPQWSKPGLTLLALWGIGDLMVIFMAAMLDVPREQYEAAELDGAHALQRFRWITLPTIRPIILFAVVTGVIQTMQYYTQAIIAGKVASGVVDGPGTSFEPGYPQGSTLTLPQLVYSLGFQHFDTGSACVVALVLFALAMAFTMLLMRRSSGLLGEEG